MSSVQRVRIADVVGEPATWNPRLAVTDEPFPYIDISSIDPEQKTIGAIVQMLPRVAPSRARQLVQKNDILISTVRPNLNAVAIVPDELDGATASTGLSVLRPDRERIQPRYLFHWVQAPEFVRYLSSRATGASYPAVTERVIRDSPLPLPSIAEQRWIATVLDKADSIRHKRRESLRLLDRFLHSTFCEMFGDPVTNQQGWDVVELEHVADIVSGVTKGRDVRGARTTVLPYLRVANVQDGYLDLDEVKTIAATAEEIARYRLKNGDVLLTEGGDPDKLGRGAVWRGEIHACIHQNHVFRVRLESTAAVPEYLSALLGSASGKRYFLKAAKQTTGIASINRTQLGRFPVLLPPVDLQQRYRAVVLEVADLTARLHEAAVATHRLLRSLGQEAFA